MSRAREESICAKVAGQLDGEVKIFDCEFSNRGMIVFLDTDRGRLTLYVRVPFQATIQMAADMILAQIQMEVLHGEGNWNAQGCLQGS